MEEAEVLCDRVAMIDKGRMACVGRPVELKTRYGAGYTLHILHKEKDSSQIEKYDDTPFSPLQAQSHPRPPNFCY
jgi:ABC-type multidrug transport system ATPase subunit